MIITELTPVFRTWDISGSVAFYRDVLGFDVLTHEEHWAMLAFGTVRLMLSAPNAHEGDVKPGFTGSLYFRVTDAQEVWERVHEKASICYPIEDFEYGMREFGIYDNNGYLLQFGQDLEQEGL